MTQAVIDVRKFHAQFQPGCERRQDCRKPDAIRATGARDQNVLALADNSVALDCNFARALGFSPAHAVRVLA